MGWTGLYHKPANILKYFEERWGAARADGTTVKCLGQSFVGSVLYGVWQFIAPDGTPGVTFATVTLTARGKKDDRCEWYYKDMDETVGPCECHCPKSLLKKLKTPAYNDHARAWRKACWQHALGLTRAGVLTKARRMWSKNRYGALQLIREWNKKHPLDAIKLR